MTASHTRFVQKGSLLAVLALGALGPSLAQAHFIQQEPPSYSEQNTYGNPQKSEPCGQADPGDAVKMTNKVTTYTQGQKITLTINETIPHPGHYRISIANSLNALPTDPVVTPNGSDPCGSTPIIANPTLPLVADGVFKHTAAFTQPQTAQIQLPPNLTCTNCVMQITEFMSNHALNNPGGCYYHHCATISIVPAGTPVDGGAVDASTGAPDAATTETPPTVPTGCGYYLGAAAAPAALYLASPFVLGLLLRRRRRASAA